MIVEPKLYETSKTRKSMHQTAELTIVHSSTKPAKNALL